MTRNPKWWGTPPLLDSITYTVLDDAAAIPALQNNAIDAAGLAVLDELTIAQRTAGVSIRRAPRASWYHFTFNGAQGSILADQALRTGGHRRASTARPSPTSPSAGWPTTRHR